MTFPQVGLAPAALQCASSCPCAGSVVLGVSRAGLGNACAARGRAPWWAPLSAHGDVGVNPVSAVGALGGAKPVETLGLGEEFFLGQECAEGDRGAAPRQSGRFSWWHCSQVCPF